VRIEATGTVPAAPEAVFRFLSDLKNHWKLANSWIRVVELDDGGSQGGRVRIHGPLGMRRTARTVVVDAVPDHVIHGTAELSGGTFAQISWELQEDVNGTAVRLSADIEHLGPLDRVLLALGGRPWMKKLFDRILARLAELFADSAVPVDRAGRQNVAS
jgi:carbon monoxide dehydrogenase subunit G